MGCSSSTAADVAKPAASDATAEQPEQVGVEESKESDDTPPSPGLKSQPSTALKPWPGTLKIDRVGASWLVAAFQSQRRSAYHQFDRVLTSHTLDPTADGVEFNATPARERPKEVISSEEDVDGKILGLSAALKDDEETAKQAKATEDEAKQVR